MNEYLTKPLDKKLLLSMVHKCSTTVPILHPNMNWIMDLTPDSEINNPLDTPNYKDSRHSHSNPELPTLQRKPSRGALLRSSAGAAP